MNFLLSTVFMCGLLSVASYYMLQTVNGLMPMPTTYSGTGMFDLIKEYGWVALFPFARFYKFFLKLLMPSVDKPEQLNNDVTNTTTMTFVISGLAYYFFYLFMLYVVFIPNTFDLPEACLIYLMLIACFSLIPLYFLSCCGFLMVLLFLPLIFLGKIGAKKNSNI